MKCPLCDTITNKKISSSQNRDYYICKTCELIFINPKLLLEATEEKARYETHENTIESQGYVDFLNRAIIPSLDYIKDAAYKSEPIMEGLDFGCGPGPVLSQLLEQRNIKCSNYDPFYYPDFNEQKKYDFIFATECFEHFYFPKNEIEKILSVLKSNGILTVMTELWTNLETFPSWYYLKDPTHVSLFNENTIKYICKVYGFKILFSDNQRVIILRKQ